MNFDTIAVISTAPGEGAIGIVRMTGSDSFKISQEIFRPKNTNLDYFEDKKMIYGHIMDGEEIVDEVLVTFMYGPKTYTTEDMVEISCHGGVVPLQRILKLLLKKGARMAEPGEFTKRAFLNGRLDLAQAESVMDLISAKTAKGFDVAFSQLKGELSEKVNDLRDKLVEVMAHLEVCIDYPEEDIEEITYTEVIEKFDFVKSKVELLVKSGETGKIIRDGLSTVIVGKPNVGKSSLLNALLKEARAIVTDIPGTTRDIIEEYVNIGGVPLKIVDTAGIRNTEDVVEKIGVERSKEFFNKADLVIFVLNSGEELSDEDREIMEFIKEKKAIVIINKTDLEQKIQLNEVENVLHDKVIIRTSVTNEHGIEDLEKAIVDMIYGGVVKSKENSYVSNVRHMDALEKAFDSMNEAIKAAHDMMPYDFIMVDVKNAYEYLGEISGETIEDDLVTKIFSNFCLGK